MNQPAKAKSLNVSVAVPIVLYGLDANSKPRAARFPERLCDLAIKAAQQLKLNVLKITSDEFAQVAGRLPAGRINSTGKGLVPSVNQALYDQVVALAGGAAAPSSVKSSAVPNGFTKVPLNEAGKHGNSVGSEGLPKDWKDIGPDHLVLVQETLRDGWWECIVVERNDDMLTVRWRDYPKWKPFTVHADAVALLNASPSFKV
jgi:hypothetical protein